MAEVSADTLLGGKVRFAQPTEGYRVAIDPVLLAAATPVGRGDRVLDAGCGTGAAMLCLLVREPRCSVLGIDSSAEACDIARLNITANGLDDRAGIRTADLASGVRDEPEPFNVVVTNPPYLAARAGTPSPHRPRAGAHVESITLRSWLAVCLAALRPGGWLVMIHRADRAADVCAALVDEAGDIGLMPLWPKADAPAARRLLVRARKGSRGPACVARGLVLHEPDGSYTEEAQRVLRHGGGLEWPR